MKQLPFVLQDAFEREEGDNVMKQIALNGCRVSLIGDTQELPDLTLCHMLWDDPASAGSTDDPLWSLPA